VAGLILRYPDLKTALEGSRTLGGNGEDSGRDAEVATEIATAGLAEARRDLNEVLAVLTRRTKTLARLRLAGGVISSVSSVGMIAALLGSSFRAQISSAFIAFLASMLALIAGYIEDFSGGDGSVRRLRELMTNQVRRLAELDGEVKSALAMNDKSKIVSELPGISAVIGEIQYARAQLGLAI
jgi:hypothetical protein